MNWSWTASPVQAAAVTATALLLTAIGLLALLRRGHWLTTLLFSSAFLSFAAFHAGTVGLVHGVSFAGASEWATYLVRVSALVSWLWMTLSVVLGRPDPRQHLRQAGAYLALSLLGCLVLTAIAGSAAVIRRVDGIGPEAVIIFGPLGKLYLMYLVLAMMVVLMNLESMLRNAPVAAQERLRPLFLAILVAILAELLVVSAALLHGGLRVRWLVTSAPVVFAAGCVAALALARRRLSDMSVPVARPVIYYSSVSLTLAGVFLLGTAILSRLVPAMSAEWRLGVTVSFLIAVGGGGLLLLVHPATGRAIRRFIDRNLYANRYDYRREWERVSTELSPSARPEEMCRRIEALVLSVFDAERVAIYLRDDQGVLRRCHGDRRLPGEIAFSHPVARTLAARRTPIVFRELDRDLDHLALVVESEPWRMGMEAAVCAPLAMGDGLVGVLWVSARRGGEPWSWEDVEFLSAMSRHLAASLWAAQQAEHMAEARQLESLHRLSSYVLHDIKNQVSGLSLVVENARRHMGNPEFQRDAMAVVERTVESLRELMDQVSGVGRQPPLTRAPVRVGDLVGDALTASGLGLGERQGVTLAVDVAPAEQEAVVDRRRIGRVLVNLLINAREAVSDAGRISLAVTREHAGAGDWLVLAVSDDGRGMSEEFMRHRLFRPFQTTKRGGLGIGLAQCRGIVEAHGGRIEVESVVGEGTTFRVRVPWCGEAAEPPAEPMPTHVAGDPR